MAERETHPSRKGYVCMDGEEDVVHGTHANLYGALFHFQEAVYGSLPCLPSIGGTRAYLRSFHTRCIVYVTYIKQFIVGFKRTMQNVYPFCSRATWCKQPLWFSFEVAFCFAVAVLGLTVTTIKLYTMFCSFVRAVFVTVYA